jgi:hypothetical protein
MFELTDIPLALAERFKCKFRCIQQINCEYIYQEEKEILFLWKIELLEPLSTILL